MACWRSTWSPAVSTTGPAGFPALRCLTPQPAPIPDGDGLANPLEYVSGTDPRYSNPGGLQSNASGTNLLLTFSRTDASETPDTALVVEISNDLVDWTSHSSYSIGADTTGSSAGVTVAKNAAAADTITVTVPKASNVKMFGRLRAIVTE